jgi:phage gp46-like protein
VNEGFWDLSAEERGHWYDRAREETGSDFWDLPPEERGRYYEQAAEEDRDAVT